MELRNYRKFRQASLEFPDGVVGVLGPNGSGKSTLLEAVAWALYGNEGEIVRQGKAGVRSSLAGMNDECSVVLEFEIAGDHYRVLRAMKGKAMSMDAQLTVNGKQLARGDKGVSDEVRRILGMDYKSFFISVFARQKELNALSALKPAERGKVVRRMLGIESLTKTVEDIDRERNRLQDRLFDMQKDLASPDGRKRSEALRSELSQVSEMKAQASQQLRALQERKVRMDATMQEATARRDALSKMEEGHRELQSALLAKRKDEEAARSNIHRASAQVQVLASKRLEWSSLALDHAAYEDLSRRKELLDERSQLHVRRSSLEQQRSVAEGKLVKARAEVEERSRAAAACSDSKKRLLTVEESVASVRQERDSFKEGMSVSGAEVLRLGREMERSSKKLEDVKRLGPESQCPTCERKMCEQHPFLVEKLEREMTELTRQREELGAESERFGQELEQRNVRLEALEKRKRDLQSKCEEEVRAQESLRSSQEKAKSLEEETRRLQGEISEMGELEYSEEEHAAVKRRISALKPRWERHQALGVELEVLPRWEEEVKEQEARLGSLEEQRGKLEAEVQALGYREGERKEAQAALDELVAQREAFNRDVAQVERELTRLKVEESSRAERLQELEQRERTAEELSRQLEEQSALSRAMRDFRESMMARVVPTLSEVSSRLFSELTDGKYAGMRLNQEYEISIYDKGEEFPLQRFSGGEADLANLCLRLAISKVIAERAGSALNFLILDEIFGSQDQERKRNIMESFAQLSRQFAQILLITHIEDIKDLVNAVVVVSENEDGSSSVSVVG